MQSVTIQAQTQMFLLSCGFGFLLGILYDAFRIFRMAFFSNKYVIVVQDILYFGLAGYLTFSFLLVMNFGEIRGYVILGEVFGWIIYYGSIGKVVFDTFSRIIDTVKKIIEFIITALSAPFYLLFRVTAKLSRKIGEFCKKIYEKIIIKLRITLKHGKDLLYNHIMVRKKNKTNSEDDKNGAPQK
jgi:spore cortex biosynthesis protein YabQ